MILSPRSLPCSHDSFAAVAAAGSTGRGSTGSCRAGQCDGYTTYSWGEILCSDVKSVAADKSDEKSGWILTNWLRCVAHCRTSAGTSTAAESAEKCGSVAITRSRSSCRAREAASRLRSSREIETMRCVRFTAHSGFTTAAQPNAASAGSAAAKVGVTAAATRSAGHEPFDVYSRASGGSLRRQAMHDALLLNASVSVALSTIFYGC